MYEKYKAKKLTKKVGSIVKDGNKYLTILRPGKRPMFAGGSVDEGETTRQAIVREIFKAFKTSPNILCGLFSCIFSTRLYNKIKKEYL